MQVTLYKNIHQVTDGLVYDINHILNEIKNGRWQDLCISIAIEKDKSERQRLKKKVPYFTTSGTFATRNNEGLIQHSGLIAIDIDDVPNINSAFDILAHDKYTYSVFRSISTKGLCCIVKIDNHKHGDAFDGLQQYYYNLLGISIDPSCKDVARARFISYDPDLIINSNSSTFKDYLTKQSRINDINASKSSFLHTNSKFERILSAINKDITGDYKQWLTIGFAIANTYGENGINYYHLISKYSQSYNANDTERQYKHCLKYNNGKITINSFYYYCKLNGIQIHDEREEYISKLTYYAKESNKKPDDVIQMIDGQLSEQDSEVINAVFNSKDFKPNKDDKKLAIDDVELWLRSNYPIKKNIITRSYELNGRELEMEDLNTIYIDGKKKFDKLTREIFDTILFSTSTPSYNPIKDYFDELNWDCYDRIDDLTKSITSDTGDHAWRRQMITKWLIGIIESIYDGEPNVLCLVLAGAKNTGKTQFFKRLLPTPLVRFFANSQLDKGKDDELLMTQKLIIFDDEYSGKSKQDSKHMKKMLSSDSFTLREPYGRKNITLPRVATLCGTCNETELLNDSTGNRRIIIIEATGRFDYQLYNNIDKQQLFAQVKELYLDGVRSQLSTDEIDLLEHYTSGRYSEVSIEAEMVYKYFEPVGQANDHCFKTTSEIKDLIEMATKQKLSVKKLGMELKRLGYNRIKKNGMYGYVIQEKIWMNTPTISSDAIAPF